MLVFNFSKRKANPRSESNNSSRSATSALKTDYRHDVTFVFSFTFEIFGRCSTLGIS